MKRRNFIKAGAFGAAAVVTPIVVTNQNNSEQFNHASKDYAEVVEEPEEFQEYEIDVPEDWAEEVIAWS